MMKAIVSGARAVPWIIRDLAGLGGAGCIAYGAFQISEPAGWITGGALLVIAASLAALAPGDDKPKAD